MAKIEFLFTKDCSVAATMWPRVQSAFGGSEVTRVDLEAVSLYDSRRRWMSGTVLIDGVDLFGLPPAEQPILNPD